MKTIGVLLWMASAVPAGAATGFREEFLSQLDELQGKAVALAKAIPQEKYAWRPGEGVRSTSEVLLHIASSNFVYALFLGVRPPADAQLGRDTHAWETSTVDREKIVKLLEQSFERMRQATAKASDDDLDRPAKISNVSGSLRAALFQAAGHLHEHLGQLIAYARVGGITPPFGSVDRKLQ
jgi:uncharacterized damage-inducible protein DinB